MGWKIVQSMEKCDDATCDLVPIVKHTEAMMDEIDQMVCASQNSQFDFNELVFYNSVHTTNFIQVEVEMEDVDDDPVLNIDSSDGKNPLAVVEYIEDIYAHHRETEVS